MELLNNLVLGFGVALAPANLLCALAGCVLGTLVGVLPGMGPVAAMAMLLPASTSLPPVSALILLAGIYYGAQYGASVTAILVKPPADPSRAGGCVDGYQMALQGRAGPALAAAGFASFFAGCAGVLVLAVFAPVLNRLALQFGAVEYFALMVLGLVGCVVMAPGSLLKAIGMVLLGLLLGLVGRDAPSGVLRFSLDVAELSNGIGLVALAMGVFGYGAIMSRLGQPEPAREVFAARVRGFWPGRSDFKNMTPAVLRGTVAGSLLGVIPGGGALLASCAACAMEKKVQAKPGEVPFGQGNIRAVAAPGSAHNAGAVTAFLPLLALGIPSNAVMVLMAGALTLHNIQPGPQLMAGDPGLFWGLLAALLLGKLMLVLLKLPLQGLWPKLLRVPYRWLFPAVVLLCAIGAYSMRHSSLDVWLVAAFGLVGYVFHKLGMAPAPLLLGFILGPRMEENLRAALQLSHGDWSVFVMRPLPAGLLLAALCMVFLVLTPAVQSRRVKAMDDA